MTEHLDYKRRGFLKAAVAAGAGTLAACSAEVRQDDKAGSAAESFPKELDTVDPAKMPMTKIGDVPVSRLVMGSNPVWGYSHRGKLLSDLMNEFYTKDRVVEVLHHAEACGINTWQSSVSGEIMECWPRYKDEGGKMNLVLLVHPFAGTSKSPAWVDTRKNIMTTLKPAFLAFHGQAVDRAWREGKMDTVRDGLNMLKEEGIPVACSTHTPACLQYMADKNFETDFFMCSFYEASKPREAWIKELGEKPLHEMYTEKMPERMTAVIRNVPRTCLCYKILAAGRLTDTREQVDQCFKWAFEHIKPQDAVIVGMFPKFWDQVAESARLAIQYGQASGT